MQFYNQELCFSYCSKYHFSHCFKYQLHKTEREMFLNQRIQYLTKLSPYNMKEWMMQKAKVIISTQGEIGACLTTTVAQRNAAQLKNKTRTLKYPWPCCSPQTTLPCRCEWPALPPEIMGDVWVPTATKGHVCAHVCD